MPLVASVKAFARRHLPEKQLSIARRVFHGVAPALLGPAVRGDLVALATLHGTDKWNAHWYIEHYDRHFRERRGRPLTLLEIGIGGDDRPDVGGSSLRMWRDYFPRALIAGIDQYDKTQVRGPRIRTFQGDQSDPEFLAAVVQSLAGVDIVIDDGSHRSSDVLASFATLFPLLRADGIYVIEDVETSYWPEYGGCPDPKADATTTVGFAKRLLDGLNYREWRDENGPDAVPSFNDRHVVAVHAYHNLFFIEKGLNIDRGGTVSRRAESP